jgi:hypothetical protein
LSSYSIYKGIKLRAEGNALIAETDQPEKAQRGQTLKDQGFWFIASGGAAIALAEIAALAVTLVNNNNK